MRDGSQSQRRFWRGRNRASAGGSARPALSVALATTGSTTLPPMYAVLVRHGLPPLAVVASCCCAATIISGVGRRASAGDVILVASFYHAFLLARLTLIWWCGWLVTGWRQVVGNSGMLSPHRPAPARLGLSTAALLAARR